MARKIDEQLYQDTKSNLLSAAKGDPDIIEIVEDQLRDMKETGYFDLKEKRIDKIRKSA